MLSKALVVGTYQRKLEELARLPGVELTAIVPPYWEETKVGRLTLEKRYTNGYTLAVEPMRFNGHFHVHYYPHLERYLKAIRPDIFHIDEESYNLATAQAMYYGQKYGARSLFYNYANIYRNYPPPFNLFEKYNFAHATYAVASNREAVEILRRRGYRGPATIIPQFGVDQEIYRPDPERRAARLASGTPFTIGYIGRLVEQKGVVDLLNACAKLEGSWRLRFTGRGVMEEELRRTTLQLGLNERVEFRSGIPSSDVPAELNELDVLVLPSLTRPNWKEQFGRILVEAMACGIPVIGSDSGEIPHVIGEGGLIFPEGDRRALGEQLALLAGDPVRRQAIGERGRARVLANYTQAQVAARYYEVYSEMVNLAL